MCMCVCVFGESKKFVSQYSFIFKGQNLKKAATSNQCAKMGWDPKSDLLKEKAREERVCTESTETSLTKSIDS